MEYVQFYKGDKLGIKDAYGRVVIPAQYDMVTLDSDGLFTVREGKKHAYFDTGGRVVLPFEERYESYGEFTEGLARVRHHQGQWGYINKTGQEVIAPQFFFAEEFSNGLAIVRNEDGLHGAIDKTGRLTIDYRFNVLLPFKAGYARFGDQHTFGLIDKQGCIVVPQQYTFVEHIIHNKVRVRMKEGEDEKEGLLTIGGHVKWNNNLDKQNAYRRRCKDFKERCEALVKELYQQGCPCEYERFRNYIQWNKNVQFIDQDILYSSFAPYLEKINEERLKCKTCGSIYTEKWEQYSVSMDVMKVVLTKEGSFVDKGAKLSVYIPYSLGFRGHHLAEVPKTYIREENEVVINYLKETPRSSRPWTGKRSWWKTVFYK